MIERMAGHYRWWEYNKPRQLLLGGVRLSREPFLKSNLTLTAKEKHELNLKSLKRSLGQKLTSVFNIV